MPPPALDLIRGKKGGRGIPPLAIGPECQGEEGMSPQATLPNVLIRSKMGEEVGPR